MIRVHRASRSIDGSSCQGCGKSTRDLPNGLRAAELSPEDLWAIGLDHSRANAEVLVRVCSDCGLDLAETLDRMIGLRSRT